MDKLDIKHWKQNITNKQVEITFHSLISTNFKHLLIVIKQAYLKYTLIMK